MRKETLTLSLRLRLSRDLFPQALLRRSSHYFLSDVCDCMRGTRNVAAGLGARCRASLHAFGPCGLGFGAC